MKRFNYFSAISLVLILLVSCGKDTTDENVCTPKELNFSKDWQTELSDLYNYQNSYWFDLGTDIAILTSKNTDNVINVFNKNSGEIINSFSFNNPFHFEVVKHDKLLIYEFSSSIYICDPYTSNIKEIDINGNISKFIINDNKILIAKSPNVDTSNVLLMIDIDSYEIDSLKYEKHSEFGDTYNFKNPYLFVTSNNDSLLYFHYHKKYQNFPNDLIMFNFKTAESDTLVNTKLWTSRFISNNGKLFTLDGNYIYKLDPYTLNTEWSVKYTEKDFFPSKKIEFIDDNIILSNEQKIASVNLIEKKLNWQNNYGFSTLRHHYKSNNKFFMKKNIYITYDENFKYFDLNTGEISSLKCDIPDELNMISTFSDFQSVYGITFDKKLVKYTE